MEDLSSITSGQLVFQMMLAIATVAIIIFWLGVTVRNNVVKMMYICIVSMGASLIIGNLLSIVDICLIVYHGNAAPVAFVCKICQHVVAFDLIYISVFILCSFKKAIVWKPAFIAVPASLVVVMGISNVVAPYIPFFMRRSVGISLCSLIVVEYCMVCFALGLIPNNRMLRIIFERSSLKMQIIDSTGTRFILSKDAQKPEEKVLKQLLCGIQTIMADENTVLISKKCGKNYVVWEQDLTGINEIRRETSELVRSLVAANKILSEREDKEKKVETKRVAAIISNEIEQRLKDKMDELLRLCDELVAGRDSEVYLSEIALLLCYIKRSVNFYFLSREKDYMEYDEYTVFADELCDISGYADLKIMNISTVNGSIPIHIATLGYEFMYELLRLLIGLGVKHALIRFVRENGSDYMRIIPSKRVSFEDMSPELLECIKKMHFVVEETGSEDMFMLSFHVDRDYMEKGDYYSGKEANA